MKIFFVLLSFYCVLLVAQQAPKSFIVEFATTVNNGTGNIVLNITRSFAPNGVDRFYELLGIQYYNENGFFRVVPGFVGTFVERMDHLLRVTCAFF
jgi:hypothetical protein